MSSSSSVNATGRLVRRKSVPDSEEPAGAAAVRAAVSGGRGAMGMTSNGPAQRSHIVANLLGDMGRDQKSKLQEKLRSQVSVKGRNPSSNGGRGRPAVTATATRLTVKSVFNHYCRGYLPPGQTFDYIEKKAQVMDLKHFYDFMKDFGLFPGCFSSRQEVTQLFQKLNLMSKKKESRVELSRAQFETFIQGVLDLKAPVHQRGMTSEDALNTWRRGKLSGDFSHWRPFLQPASDHDAQHLLDAITEFEDHDDKAESVTADDDHDPSNADDDDDDDDDGDGADQGWAVRQEIAIRNEQIRELLGMIWGETRCPSLPFLMESGISMAADRISISNLQLERDQIQECIDLIGAQLRNLDAADPDAAADLGGTRPRLHLLEQQQADIEGQVHDLYLNRYQVQAAFNDLIEQMELCRRSSHEIIDYDQQQQQRLRDHLAQESHRRQRLQTSSSNLEQRLHQAEQQLEECRQHYENKIAIMSKELNSAMAALMSTRADLEAERQRSCAFQDQIQLETNNRQCLSLQISDAVQQIGRDHEQLVQRQTAIHDAVVQEMHQVLAQETERSRLCNDSIRSLLQQVQELEAQSRRYSDEVLKERENSLTLQMQLEQSQNNLNEIQSKLLKQQVLIEQHTERYCSMEKMVEQVQQERDQLIQIKEHHIAELKSCMDTITILKSEIISMQNCNDKDRDLLERLSKENASIEADRSRVQSELQLMSESYRQKAELYQNEHERCVQLANERDDAQNTAKNIQAALQQSAEHHQALQQYNDELQTRLSHMTGEIEIQMKKMLAEKQAELENCREDLQEISERLYKSVQVAEDHRQNDREKLEIWEKTTMYLSMALEQSTERAEKFHNCLQDQTQQTEYWSRRAAEQELILSQIAHMAKIRDPSQQTISSSRA